MEQNQLSTDPSNQYVPLLRIEYGQDFGRIERYARFDKNINVNGFVWKGVPDLEIEFPPMEGSADSKDFLIKAPSRYAPFASLATGEPHSEINILVAESSASAGGGSPSYTELYYGNVISVTRVPEDQGSSIELKVASLKSQLETPLGIVTGTSCPWTFGDRSCLLNIIGLKDIGIAQNSGSRFLVVSDIAITTEGYWARGYAEWDGLSILIREQPAGNTMILAEACPQDWAGKEITLTPGCKKTITACRTWNNEEHFAGIGLAMPSYDPRFDKP